MKVLFVLAALMIFTGCSEKQELTGPWEMWVLVCSPTSDDVWSISGEEVCTISWAAVPGETIRCDLIRHGELVMEVFDWRSREPGRFLFRGELSPAGSGDGYQIVVMDDQGFYGVSEEFSIR